MKNKKEEKFTVTSDEKLKVIEKATDNFQKAVSGLDVSYILIDAQFFSIDARGADVIEYRRERGKKRSDKNGKERTVS